MYVQYCTLVIQLSHSCLYPKKENAISCSRCSKSTSKSPPLHLCQIESITRHATSVLANQVLTCVLWIGGVGEEHAFVASGLLVFAYATGLEGDYVSAGLRLLYTKLLSKFALVGGYNLP